MSLYAPWIQPGHTHEARPISLPLKAEHQTLLDGTRAVLGLRELSRKVRSRGHVATNLADADSKTGEPRDMGRHLTSDSASDYEVPVSLVISEAQGTTAESANVHASDDEHDVVVARNTAAGTFDAVEISNACQLLAVGDRHGDLSPCRLLTLRYGCCAQHLIKHVT